MPDEPPQGFGGLVAPSDPTGPGAPPSVATPPGLLPPDIVQQFLTNQAREIGVREQEAALEHVKQQNAFNYSQQALEKQSAFFMQEGTFRQTRFKWTVVMFVVFVVLVFGFLATLALTGHEAMARELFKDVGLFLGGGAGGYGVASRKSSQSPQPVSHAGAEE